MLSDAPAELSDRQSSCHPRCIDTMSLLAWLQELPAVGDAVAEAPSAGQAHVGPVPTAAQGEGVPVGEACVALGEAYGLCWEWVLR